ncbi:MAG: ABC transporter ATP-binding protein [Armatimonadota bacterium]
MSTPVHHDTPTSDTVVDLHGVCKTYRQRQRSERLGDALRTLFRPRVREVHALADVDLTIRRGEIVAYAGPNGAGKSTTVKLLTGLLHPDTGQVRVLGMDPVRQRIPCVSRLGIVFGQRTELWWDHPVAATFEWKRVVWDIPQQRFERMRDTVKELLGLGDFFHSLARELSLGQRMRADLGLALLHEPEILFLDEPTIGVDVLAKRQMVQFIKELNREKGVTVLLTSHDMAELEQLAGRIVMLAQGRIAFDGDFTELRRTYADRRVLVLHTAGETAPTLPGAELISSENGTHEYHFNAGTVALTDLLNTAAAQTELVDVESHRGSIDEVIADIYESWQVEGIGSQKG